MHMTKLLVVCLGVILSLPVNETFNLAEQWGHSPRLFFRFATSAGKYTIRYDGYVEIYTTNASGQKRKFNFFLGMVGKGRLEHVYFIEHEGDLFLRYDVTDQGSYLARVEQRSRKQKWVRPLNNVSSQAPTIYGDKVLIADTLEISKTDGRILRQD